MEHLEIQSRSATQMTQLQVTVGMKTLVIKLERVDQKKLLRAKSSATKRKDDDVEYIGSWSPAKFKPCKTDAKAQFKCEKCKKTFTAQTDLRKHELLLHRSNEKTIACQFCTKSFNPNYIAQHMMTHTKEKPYKCTLCKSAFNRTTYLRGHVQRMHEERDPDQIFTCKTCKKTFPFKGYLDSHQKVVHSNRVARLPCSYCSKLFTTNGDLRRHEFNVHTGRDLRPFSCTLCTKSFKYRCRLNTHIRVHIGEKYSCEFCFYTTLHIEKLKTHKLYHADANDPIKHG